MEAALSPEREEVIRYKFVSAAGELIDTFEMPLAPRRGRFFRLRQARESACGSGRNDFR
jgi:hypothetical protein